MLVVDPFLPDRVRDSQNRPPHDLAAQRARMDHRADVGHGQEIREVVLAGFEIHVDLGETGDIGKRLAIVRIFVARGHHQSLARQPRTDALVMRLTSLSPTSCPS